MITPERLRELVAYDPDTGIVSWLPRPDQDEFNELFAGKPAGYFRDGYGTINLRPEKCQISYAKVAWCLHTGQWPKHMVGHIDEDRRNFRWSNLQEFDVEKARQRRRTWGKSGIKGVGYCEGRRLAWRGQIYYEGHGHQKYFESKEEASAWVEEQRRLHHRG